MLLTTLLTDYIKYEKGLAPHSVELYQSRLRHLIWKWLPENGYPNPDTTVFSAPVLRRYLYAQGERGLRPRTVRGMFHPIRGVGDYMVDHGILAANPACIITLPKKDAPDRKYVSDQELNLMMTAIERLSDPRKTAFLHALFSVLINCGPRAQEMLDMKISNFSRDTKTLVIPHGKGEKARVLHPPADTLAALSEWLVMREEMGFRHDWLWAITVSRRLGYDGLRGYVGEVKCLAGLRDHANIHCHSIRRAFAQRMMNRSATIKAIQAAMGHAHPETTFVYLNMGEQEARVMSDLGALERPKLQAPKVEPCALIPVAEAPAEGMQGTLPTPATESSQVKDVVKNFGRAAFHSHRRRTPAK